MRADSPVLNFKHCRCAKPTPKPIRENARTSVCTTCGSWFSLSAEEVPDWEAFKTFCSIPRTVEEFAIFCADE